MKYDAIIIGGGLGGMTAGIALAKAGVRTAMVSSGQSALHFSSGSLELLAGKDPFRAMQELPANHPYRIIGPGKVESLLGNVKQDWAEAGITLRGDGKSNHFRITPIGAFKSAWLTIDDYLTVEDPDKLPMKTVAVLNISGYLDFHPGFISASLERRGVKCKCAEFTIAEFEKLRKSYTEMRSTNLARVLGDRAIDSMARRINELSKGCDMVIMPAVVGLFDERPVKLLRSKLNVPLYMVATMPVTVPGVRAQMLLRDRFKALGGTVFLGDTVTGGSFEGNRLTSMDTANLGKGALSADKFILATGSFFSHGLCATPERIYEPVFGLDIEAPENRSELYDKNFYAQQSYMNCGVKTSAGFKAMRDGSAIDNLIAAGSVLPGCNAVELGCGAGTTIATSLMAVENILK